MFFFAKFWKISAIISSSTFLVSSFSSLPNDLNIIYLVRGLWASIHIYIYIFCRLFSFWFSDVVISIFLFKFTDSLLCPFHFAVEPICWIFCQIFFMLDIFYLLSDNLSISVLLVLVSIDFVCFFVSFK